MSLYIINHDTNLFIIIYLRQSIGGKTVVKLFPASCPANSSYYWRLVCSAAWRSNSRRPRFSYYFGFFCGRRFFHNSRGSLTYFSFSDPFTLRFGCWFSFLFLLRLL